MNRYLLPLALAAGAVPAHAADFTSIGTLSQDEFRRLAQDLGAAISYKGVTPATPLGAVGFDIGLEVTDTRVGNSEVFSRAGAGGHSHLVIPKLHVYKGLFAGFDIGGFVAGATEVSATVFGADLRYAVIDDTLTTPALALRLSGTKAGGLGDLSMATGAFDVMLSKKLAAFTPYAGAGTVRVKANARGTALSEESFNKSRVFGGLNVNLIAMNFAFEVERMGSNTSLSAKAGWRF